MRLVQGRVEAGGVADMSSDPTTYPNIRVLRCNGTPDGKMQVLETMAVDVDLVINCPCGDILQLALVSGWSAKRGLFVDLREPAKWKKGP